MEDGKWKMEELDGGSQMADVRMVAAATERKNLCRFAQHFGKTKRSPKSGVGKPKEPAAKIYFNTEIKERTERAEREEEDQRLRGDAEFS